MSADFAEARLLPIDRQQVPKDKHSVHRGTESTEKPKDCGCSLCSLRLCGLRGSFFPSESIRIRRGDRLFGFDAG